MKSLEKAKASARSASVPHQQRPVSVAGAPALPLGNKPLSRAQYAALGPRIPEWARYIQQPTHQGDNVCGFYAMLNCLEDKEKRLAFCCGNEEKPEDYFRNYIMRVFGDSGENGYNQLMFCSYLEHVQKCGFIRSWTFKRLKLFDIEDLLLNQFPVHDGDNVVVFGVPSDPGRRFVIPASLSNAISSALHLGLDPLPAKRKALKWIVAHCQRQTRLKQGAHAVGIRYRIREEGYLVGELVDSAMQTVKVLDFNTYAFSMEEFFHNRCATSRHYLFRIEV